MAVHYPRFVRQRLEDALLDTPVVAVNGARQVGKSTLVADVVDTRPDARIVTLDDAIQLEAARHDPRAFVEHDGLLVIDEVQRAPELLAAIKATVDRRRTPGRFLLTGSTRLLTLPELSESLAGRVEIIDLWPLSQREVAERPGCFVDALLTWSDGLRADSELTRREYDDRVSAGGFPEPFTRTGRRRRAWFDNYATTVLQRMVQETADVERLAALPRILQLCAARTGNVLNVRDLANDAGLPERTTAVYLGHLQAVFLVQLLPAWSRNLTSKVAHRPKVLVTDSGLAANLLGVDADALGQPAGPIGPLLETFVAMEVRKQLGWADTGAELYHFRDRGGTEVDLVLETRSGRVAGIEVKASSTVRASDFKGLRLLQERLGGQFVGGVVLHRGPDAVPFGERLLALPIAALWQVRA